MLSLPPLTLYKSRYHSDDGDEKRWSNILMYFLFFLLVRRAFLHQAAMFEHRTERRTCTNMHTCMHVQPACLPKQTRQKLRLQHGESVTSFCAQDTFMYTDYSFKSLMKTHCFGFCFYVMSVFCFFLLFKIVFISLFSLSLQSFHIEINLLWLKLQVCGCLSGYLWLWYRDMVLAVAAQSPL